MNKALESIKASLGCGEAVLIKSETNRFYLTRFSSSDGYVLITDKKSVFLVDFRYYEKAKSEIKDFEVLLLTDTKRQLNEVLSGAEKIYTECDRLTVNEFLSLRKILGNERVTADGKLSDLIKSLRSVKEKDEILLVKKAQEITDKTFGFALDIIKAGKTEKEIALEMEFYLRNLGSEGVSFDFIVVSGKNSSLPHGVPTDKKIENGDFVTMDFGAVVGGFRSDMTRTVAVGYVNEKQKRVYDTVLKAQELALKEIKAGKICKDIDKTARDFIESEGFGGTFGHGLGHSVGIEIHESPCFNTRDTSKLCVGNILTVEPGIYLFGEFGVRIEDMVIITENGAENITKSPKDLIIL